MERTSGQQKAIQTTTMTAKETKRQQRRLQEQERRQGLLANKREEARGKLLIEEITDLGEEIDDLHRKLQEIMNNWKALQKEIEIQGSPANVYQQTQLNEYQWKYKDKVNKMNTLASQYQTKVDKLREIDTSEQQVALFNRRDLISLDPSLVGDIPETPNPEILEVYDENGELLQRIVHERQNILRNVSQVYEDLDTTLRPPIPPNADMSPADLANYVLQFQNILNFQLNAWVVYADASLQEDREKNIKLINEKLDVLGQLMIRNQQNTEEFESMRPHIGAFIQHDLEFKNQLKQEVQFAQNKLDEIHRKQTQTDSNLQQIVETNIQQIQQFQVRETIQQNIFGQFYDEFKSSIKTLTSAIGDTIRDELSKRDTQQDIRDQQVRIWTEALIDAQNKREEEIKSMVVQLFQELSKPHPNEKNIRSIDERLETLVQNTRNAPVPVSEQHLDRLTQEIKNIVKSETPKIHPGINPYEFDAYMKMIIDHISKIPYLREQITDITPRPEKINIDAYYDTHTSTKKKILEDTTLNSVEKALLLNNLETNFYGRKIEKLQKDIQNLPVQATLAKTESPPPPPPPPSGPSGQTTAPRPPDEPSSSSSSDVRIQKALQELRSIDVNTEGAPTNLSISTPRTNQGILQRHRLNIPKMRTEIFGDIRQGAVDEGVYRPSNQARKTLGIYNRALDLAELTPFVTKYNFVRA